MALVGAAGRFRRELFRKAGATEPNQNLRTSKIDLPLRSDHCDRAKAASDEAALHYRQTTLTALRDVSDALSSRERLAEIREQRALQVAALETAVKLSSERYIAGKASYYEVLEAQQQLFPAELSLARTQRDQLLAVVALYKGLGGGWQDDTSGDQQNKSSSERKKS